LIQSMTGFSEKRFHSRNFSAKISIKSLNHRYLDWIYNGPQVGEVEFRLRNICQRKLRRGRIEVFLEMNFFNHANWDIKINNDLLEKVFSSLEKTSSRLGKTISISVENLFRIPQAVTIRRKDFSEEEKVFLEKGFEKTLEEVIKQRRREGKETGKAIRGNVQNIKQAVKRVEKLAKGQPLLIREKLEQRLRELTNDIPYPEDRLIEEAAFYAQKYDIAEEIVRLKSHLNYVQELLLPQKKEPVGRKLDFISQEIYRETNTIGSKSQDLEITKECLAIKGELESIRQQVQNIE